MEEPPPSTVLDGIPARPGGETPPLPTIDGDARAFSETTFSLMLLFARGILATIAGLPFTALSIVAVFLAEIDAATFLDFLYAPLTRPGFVLALLALIIASVPTGLFLQAILLRFGRVRPETHHRRSPTALRILLRTRLLETAGRWLSGTLFWPPWLRLAGASIGKGCEISSIMEVLPERVTIGASTFFADGIYLGGPTYRGGTLTVRDTRLGEGTFLGNHVVIPEGSELPRDILLGVCTRAEPERIRPGTSWFGHPPMELPRREVFELDRSLTHEPNAWRYTVRVFWEALRFVLPALPTTLVLLWFGWLDSRTNDADDVWNTCLEATFVSVSVLALFLLLVLALKWLLLGRVRPGRHGLWSGWCSRWDFLYVVWNRHARPILLHLEQTLWLAFYLRAMGMSIGKRVVLGRGFAQVVDPDMLRVEDGATFDPLLQAHSFEDRVLKIDRVIVRRGATVADQALLLYGADIGEHGHVAPQSVVMKHERLLPHRSYAGAPVREVPARKEARGT